MLKKILYGLKQASWLGMERLFNSKFMCFCVSSVDASFFFFFFEDQENPVILVQEKTTNNIP